MKKVELPLHQKNIIITRSKDNISDQELLSVFLESYVTNNKSRKIINLLFQGEILKETKDFLSFSQYFMSISESCRLSLVSST